MYTYILEHNINVSYIHANIQPMNTYDCIIGTHADMPKSCMSTITSWRRVWGPIFWTRISRTRISTLFCLSFICLYCFLDQKPRFQNKKSSL